MTKSFLLCAGLLASATMLTAKDTTAPSATQPGKTPQISLMRVADVVDPLGAPASAQPAAPIVLEPESGESGKLPLPELRVDGNLPELRSDSAAATQPKAVDPSLRLKKLWMASMVAFGAGTTVDGVSSWNKKEANPLLSSANGNFAMRGALIKAGLAAVVLVPQIIHKPENDTARKALTVINFADAGVYMAIGMRNFSLH